MILELWPAFILGLIGSLHCAGMCGPLALALPATGNTRASFTIGRLAYNLGRITTYALLGALFGAIGMSFALAGFQRWTSIIAGAFILLGLLASSRHAMNSTMARLVARLRSMLAKLLQRRSLGSIYLMGVLNGLLPCGLVYVACAGAISRVGWLGGVEYMLLFGLGTVPVMLSIGLFGRLIQAGIRLRFQRCIPVLVIILGSSLILRGMSLGIPYVSPVLTAHSVHCPACH